MTATETEYADAEVVDDDSELQRAIDAATLDGTKPAEMVHVESRSGKGFLTIDPQQTEWSATQLVALKSIGIETEGDDAVPMPHVLQFLYICQMRDLDPWLKEAYLIQHGKRWFSDNDKAWVDNRKFTLVTGIDGFRKRSEDTGTYAGQVGPEWCGEDGVWRDSWFPKLGKPEMARVGILRTGNPLPIWGVAAFDEFVPLIDVYVGTGRKRQKTGEKVPTDMWIKMPANQLAKCAEAQAHRKASPRAMSGLVIPEEMERAALEYTQEQETERKRELDARRQEAYADARTATVEGVVMPDGAQQTRAGQPVSLGESARETVENLRTNTRAPRGDSRAPKSALGNTGARVEVPDTERAAHLRAEIEMLAELFARTPGELLARQAVALGKEPSAFTVDELLASVLPLRVAGAAKLRAVGRGSEAAAYETVPKGAIMPLSVLLGWQATGEETPVDPRAPHSYVDNGGVCAVEGCDRFGDDPIHSA